MRLKFALAATTSLALTIALPTAGHAQAQSASASDAEGKPAPGHDTRASGGPSTELSEVVVTGSRIPRPEIDSAQPTTVIGQQKIEDSGFTNLGNLIRQNPLFQAYNQSSGDRANTAQGGNAGVTFPNLYNLGAQRTLTLIDGKRTVGAAAAIGSAASGLQVDISAIPIGLVERIETVSVGGAPIYGSDAIAGTVNIILKRNFDGLNFDAQGGVSEKGDGWNERAQILAGRNFDHDRGNITLSAAYTRQDGISAFDRDFNTPGGSINPVGNASQLIPTFQAGYIFLSKNGVPSNYFGIAGANATTLAPFGYYTNASGQPLRFDAGGNLVPFSLGVPLGAVVAGTALISQLPPSDLDTTRLSNPVLSPSNRYFVDGSGHYDLTDHVRFVGRFSYAHTGSHFSGSSSAPASSVLGADQFTTAQFYTPDNPFLTPASRAFFLANPTPLYALTNGNANGFYFNRDYGDLTSGAVNVNQDTFTIQAGLEGDFQALGNNYKWDLTLSHGQTDRGNDTTGVLKQRFLLANDAVLANSTLTAVLPTPAGLDSKAFTYDASAHLYRQASTGNVITCRARVTGVVPAGSAASGADIAACAPLNPFGQSNPGDVISYLDATGLQDFTVKQTYAQGNIGGDLFRLPAGPVQASVGFEYRREQAQYALDQNSATGAFLGGSTGAGVSGSFDTREIYGEVRAPILNDDTTRAMFGLPLIHSLEFDGSVRYMNNTQAGDDVTWSAGGRLAPVADVLFRGDFTHSIRQPAIAELFAGSIPQRSSVNDPCAIAFIGTGPNTAARRANCEQLVIASGIATTTAAADAFLASYASPLGGIAGTFSGNPNLVSETANSYTFGVVFTPRFLKNFSATIDYIHIDIDGEISALDANTVAADCVDNSGGINNYFCTALTRGVAGSATPFRITNFNSFYGNVNNHEFAGTTVTARYAFDPAEMLGHGGGAWGRVTLDSTLFFLDHDREGLPGQLVENRGGIGDERFRGQVGVGYQFRGFGAYVQETYYSGSKVDPNSKLFLNNDVSSYYLTDLTVKYNITPKLKASVTVNNLLDKSPPGNTFSYQYDLIGRRFLAGLSYSF